MIELTDEMQDLVNNSLAYGTPCVLSTASHNGDLTIGFRGSMMAWGKDSLAYWERGKGQSVEHLESGGQAAVILRTPEQRRRWIFFGTATVLRDGPIRQKIMDRVVTPEMDRDPDKTGFAVVIKLTRVEDLGGRTVMGQH